MKSINEAMRNLINNKMLLEMAKIDKRDYKKLPLSIWIDEAGNKRNTKHAYERVKIVNNYNDNNAIISKDIILAIKNFQNQNLLQKEVLYYLAKKAIKCYTKSIGGTHKWKIYLAR